MINWTGLHGDYFKLKIVGYQYPENNDGYDGNWLKVELDVKNELGKWTKIDPCLMIQELKWLTTWLRHVTLGESEFDAYFGFDGVIEIKYIAKAQDKFVFSVRLARIVSHPDFRDKEFDNAVIIVRLTDETITESINYLENALMEFPARRK